MVRTRRGLASCINRSLASCINGRVATAEEIAKARRRNNYFKMKLLLHQCKNIDMKVRENES